MLSFGNISGVMRQAARAASVSDGSKLLTLRLLPRYFLDFVDKHAEHENVVEEFIGKCAGSMPIKINHDQLTNGRVTDAEMCSVYQCLKAPCVIDFSAIENESLRRQITENPMSVQTSMGIDFVFNKPDVATVAIGQNKIDYLKSLFVNDPELRIVEMTPLELSIMDGQRPALPASRGAGIRLNFGDRTSNGVKVEIENEIKEGNRSKISNKMTKPEADVEMEEQAEEEEVEEGEVEEEEEEEAEEEEEQEEEEEEKPKAKKRSAPPTKKAAPPPKKQIKLNNGKKAAPKEEEEEAEEEEEEEEEEKEKPKKKIVLKKKEDPKKAAATGKKTTAETPAKKTTAPVKKAAGTPPAKKTAATPPAKKAAVPAGGKTTTVGKKAPASTPSKDAAKLAKELSSNEDAKAVIEKFKRRVQQSTLLHNDILNSIDDINAMDIFDDEEMEVLDEFVNSDPMDYEPKDKKAKAVLQNAAFLARKKASLADRIIELYEEDRASQVKESKKLVKPSEANAIKKKAAVSKKAAADDDEGEEDDDDEFNGGDRSNPTGMVGVLLSNWEKSQQLMKKGTKKADVKSKPLAKKK